MNLLDRILGRRVENNYTLTVESPPTPPKPHNFCAHCGEPMVDGYMVYGRTFDRATGQPTLKVLRRRLCLTLHKQERPVPQPDPTGEGDVLPSARAQEMEQHDGYPLYGTSYFWGMGMHFDPYDYIPDCEPKVAV